LTSSKNDHAPPATPKVRLSIGVTGHRQANAAFAANQAAIAQTLSEVFDILTAAASTVVPVGGFEVGGPVRLHSLLVDGSDQIAASLGLARGWEIAAPLPFGRALNTAINALPASAEEARNLLGGEGECSPQTRVRADAINALVNQSKLFELADQDAVIADLWIAKLSAPDDLTKAQAYAFAASERVRLAAQVMIEQSDFLIGVWDGASTRHIGGTGHTIALALSMGATVVWIDARAPDGWQILDSPEALLTLTGKAGEKNVQRDLLTELTRQSMQLTTGKASSGKAALEGLKALDGERWRPRSNPLWHGYRRIEALFGEDTIQRQWRRLTQTYEHPSAIAGGSGQAQIEALAALPGQQTAFVDAIKSNVMGRFAWADGISARLSDTYRGGMILSFMFSACAIVGGIAYLPFASSDHKWPFALFELVLLAGILSITFVGQKRRWHGRWFETRRVAEYFRHGPIMLALGVFRPAGRWPRSSHTNWPEWYALHGLRELGLPQVAVTDAYLRQCMSGLLAPHVKAQGDYHRAKAARLTRVHHRLDAISDVLFMLAVVSVSLYLTLKLGVALGWLDHAVTDKSSKLFTFFGVMLPTFGGAISGVRYFGDFERFAAISEVTAVKLEAIAVRINLLLAAPDAVLTYGFVSDLAHSVDDIVISEIESWQAVFAGKHITVPV
jgi:hypothetical protein